MGRDGIIVRLSLPVFVTLSSSCNELMLALPLAHELLRQELFQPSLLPPSAYAWTDRHT